MKTPASRQEGLAFINAPIRRLDSELLQLQALKSHYVRQLNEFNASTAIFPNEIMASIFEHTLQRDPTSEEGGLFTLTLSHVCAHWRHITWTTPSLWTYPTFSGSRQYTQTIQLFFRNSKSLPVSLSLQEVRNLAVYAALRDILRDNPDKLGALYCVLEEDDINQSMLWTRLCGILSQGLPKLSIIKVSFDGRNTLMLNAPPAPLPSLEHLQWTDNAGTFPSVFPCNNLKSLNLFMIQPDHCIKDLLKCPNLRDFRALARPSGNTLHLIQPPQMGTPSSPT